MSIRTSTAGALAAMTALLLGACSDNSSSVNGESPPTPLGPSASAGSTEPASSDVRTLGPATRTDLRPGRWALSAAGSHDVPRAVVEVPEAFNGGGGYLWTVGEAPENQGWILGYATVRGVHLNPCTRGGGTFDTKSSPDLFVEALAAQRGTTTSPAVPVTIDGYRGVYTKLITPTDLDFSRCRENGLAIFDTTTRGDHHLIDTPGVIERYWVLEVHGERVVLVGTVLSETSESGVDELTEIVESIRFERR